MRVATIDIGTNTVLLLVAQGEGADLSPVRERATITRLGEGVDKTGRLSDAAIERTLAALADYAEQVRAIGAERIAVVGTSAMRDARGGDKIREFVSSAFGVQARVIPGDEEARLTFRGALSGLPLDAGAQHVVFDIGGGSTEVVIGQADRIAWARSFDVGSVRLTERHGEDRAALEHAASEALSPVPALPAQSCPVGIAGTMTTLAAVSLRMTTYDAARVHGHVMQTAELARVVEQLASLPHEDRKKVAGMEPKRADVIVAGGFIALALLRRWGASEVRISDRGVRWGLAIELAS